MLKGIKNFITSLATGATIATILLMWASAYSAHIPPENHGWLDVLGLCFPIFAAGNLVALIGWLLVKSKRALLPFIGFVCCFSDLHTYCPINIPQPSPKGALKVMSYNAMNFNWDTSDKSDAIVQDIISAKADIVCIQEGLYYGDWNIPEKKLKKVYPYMEVLNSNTTLTTLRCFSRHPIVDKETLPIVSETNSVGIFRIDIGKGDTVHVINCHLQSDGLSQEDKDNYKELVKGEKRDGVKTTAFSLVKKLSAAAAKRSKQTDRVMKYISEHKGEPIILCGDFNDTPISYPRRQFSSVLKDTYKANGVGPGFSYNRDGMFVRIDHIFCSDHWKPYGTTVDRSRKHSDHYPIYTFLKRKAK